MSKLLPSFLGKTVNLDKEKEYVIRYEENGGKKRANVLLFDQETPVIFAVIDEDGDFLDSFYISNKSTQASTKSLERYNKIADRKKEYKVTQDDLRDALKPLDEAKMKNEHIMKHLVDEHLEDIKRQWPSRLLSLQNAYGKSDNSLILIALDEALSLANGPKAFQFLVRHRYDSYIPKLGQYYEQHPQLLDDVKNHYLNFEYQELVEDFINEAAMHVSTNNQELVEKLLNSSKNMDHVYGKNTMRKLLSRLFKRVKSETGDSPQNWLRETIQDRNLRQSIVQSIKKKTG